MRAAEGGIGNGIRNAIAPRSPLPSLRPQDTSNTLRERLRTGRRNRLTPDLPRAIVAPPMSNVLLAHSFFLRNDPKQVQKMKPYAPLGTLYAAGNLRDRGYD